jgi:histone H2A
MWNWERPPGLQPPKRDARVYGGGGCCRGYRRRTTAEAARRRAWAALHVWGPRAWQNPAEDRDRSEGNLSCFRRGEDGFGNYKGSMDSAVLIERFYEYSLILATNRPGGSRRNRSTRAGLHFPVGRIRRYLKRSTPFCRVELGAAVYLAGVLEYLCADALELAGNAAHENKRSRITPRHLQLAIRDDAELNSLLQHVIIPDSGVLPLVHVVLLPAFRPGTSGPASQAYAFERAARADIRATIQACECRVLCVWHTMSSL